MGLHLNNLFDMYMYKGYPVKATGISLVNGVWSVTVNTADIQAIEDKLRAGTPSPTTAVPESSVPIFLVDGQSQSKSSTDALPSKLSTDATPPKKEDMASLLLDISRIIRSVQAKLDATTSRDGVLKEAIPLILAFDLDAIDNAKHSSVLREIWETLGIWTIQGRELSALLHRIDSTPTSLSSNGRALCSVLRTAVAEMLQAVIRQMNRLTVAASSQTTPISNAPSHAPAESSKTSL